MLVKKEKFVILNKGVMSSSRLQIISQFFCQNPDMRDYEWLTNTNT